MPWQRTILYLLTTIGALFLIVVLTPVIALTTEVTEPDWYSGNGEVLVVLGGSMLVSGTGPQATLGYDSYLRCVYAAWIFRSHKFRYVVVSGGDGLANAMAKYLIDNGVDSRAILTERSAMTTLENAEFTHRILLAKYHRRKIPMVVLLTSDYHAWRAKRTFQRNGVAARTIPIPDLIKRSSSYAYRPMGAFTLFSEWAKDIFYIASGRA